MPPPDRSSALEAILDASRSARPAEPAALLLAEVLMLLTHADRLEQRPNATALRRFRPQVVSLAAAAAALLRDRALDDGLEPLVEAAVRRDPAEWQRSLSPRHTWLRELMQRVLAVATKLNGAGGSDAELADNLADVVALCAGFVAWTDARTAPGAAVSATPARR